MKKIINKIGKALALVLAAPVKLPGKVPAILKYLAIGLGIIEVAIDDDPPIRYKHSHSTGKLCCGLSFY